MFCRNCGKELKDDWSMCPYCNTKILESQNMENMSNLNVDGREDFNNTGNINRQGNITLSEFSFMKYILLSIVTLGIYGIYTQYKFTKAINVICEGDQRERPNYFLVILLTVITLGVYGHYWIYTQARRLYEISPKYDCRLNDNAINVLLWNTFGSFITIGQFVAWYKLFKMINQLIEQYNRGVYSQRPMIQEKDDSKKKMVAIIISFYVLPFLLSILLSILSLSLDDEEEMNSSQYDSVSTSLDSDDLDTTEKTLADIELMEFVGEDINKLLIENVGLIEDETTSGQYVSANGGVTVCSDENGILSKVLIEDVGEETPTFGGVTVGEDFDTAVKKLVSYTYKFEENVIKQNPQEALFYNTDGEMLIVGCNDNSNKIQGIIYANDLEILNEILMNFENSEENETDETEKLQTTIYDVDYIFPESNVRFLTNEEISSVDNNVKQMAINEIYARHGRLFNTQEIQDYFNSKQWYAGNVAPDAFNESVLNEYELANIKTLANAMGNAAVGNPITNYNQSLGITNSPYGSGTVQGNEADGVSESVIKINTIPEYDALFEVGEIDTQNMYELKVEISTANPKEGKYYAYFGTWWESGNVSLITHDYRETKDFNFLENNQYIIQGYFTEYTSGGYMGFDILYASKVEDN